MKKIIFLILLFSLLMGCSNASIKSLEDQVDALTQQTMYLEDENRNLNTQVITLEDQVVDLKESLLNQQRRDAQLLVDLSQVESDLLSSSFLGDRLEILEQKISLFSEYQVIKGHIEAVDQESIKLETEDGSMIVEEVYFLYEKVDDEINYFEPIASEKEYLFHIVNGHLTLVEAIQ